ncbi:MULTISPECIES: 4Fe-4S binding protein [Dehalococcoides]|uniref:4Fe-4S dicluster domain-containing protein n=1 Tax=Dehalococcoides TaxID=61434 RepID=UPI0028A8DA41|nr:4Fe-4S binding protein [Dehalococcoides mccartyi]
MFGYQNLSAGSPSPSGTQLIARRKLVKLHNPIPRHNSTEHIYLDTSKCFACWKCVENCPNGVIESISIFSHTHAHIRRPDVCKGCLKCAKVCPQQAITPVRSIVSSGAAL